MARLNAREYVLMCSSTSENGRAKRSLDTIFSGIVEADGVCDAGLVVKSGE